MDPAPDRDVVNRQVPLCHDLLQIAIREGVSEVPPNAQKDDVIFEIPPAEQSWPSSGHSTPYQISSTTFATEPYFRPTHSEFEPRTLWSLTNAFTSAFQELDPIPQFQATARLSGFLQRVRI